MEKAASIIKDGDMVAVGGGLCMREPIALLRELIRQGRCDLHLVGTAHGFDVDFACGGGIVGAVQETHVSFEQDFGLAPNYRRSCETGQVKIRENCCNTIIMQLRASEFGIPFVPIRSIKGSDEIKLHPEFKPMVDPFTGKKVVLVPALAPDVAIIHAQKADIHGNLKIMPPYVADVLFIRASNKVIVTAEEIIPEKQMIEEGPTIPYYETTAVVEAPFGAHPTSCYPYYAYDRENLSEYLKSARESAEAFKERYLNKYVYGVKSLEEYLEKVGGKAKRDRLASWKEGREQWMELFTYE
jgi:glutaconate CoA-transferase subunit A